MHADSYKRSLLMCVVFCFGSLSGSPAVAQPTKKINKIGAFKGAGTVVDIQPGEITIASDDGQRKSFMIQDKDERAISLDGNDYIVSMPADIHVAGNLRVELLERGMHVEFTALIDRFGRSKDRLSSLKVIQGDATKLAIIASTAQSNDPYAECTVIGRVVYCRRGKLCLEVPKSRMAPLQRITFQLTDDATFDIRADDLNRVCPGDTVEFFGGQKLDNGAHVIREIKIKLSAEREKATVSYTDQLFQKFSNLSDDPGEARTERSSNFIMHTDLSMRSAKVLLTKLESMFELVFRYYNTRPRDKIEIYVVRDLNNFSGRLNKFGAAKIAVGSGVTMSKGYSLVKGNRPTAKRTISVVFSCEDHNVVQHEAVHAFCAMAFGSTGPVWYSEGMAEVGQYWKPDNRAVEIDAVVIEYLTSSKKKTLNEIVAAGQITGDSWKAYAWRWALCHLLANNPNYSRRFKKLGMSMMSKQKDSFEIAFGDVEQEIAFEYDQFVRNLDNGYRVDLCVWDWTKTPVELTSKPEKTTVEAMAGWQATRVNLVRGQTYDVVTRGGWKVSADGQDLTADGQENGRGKLIGVVLNDFQLSPPFDLGAKRRLTAGYSGQLFVRCKDNWNHLEDNSGHVDFFIRKSTK